MLTARIGMAMCIVALCAIGCDAHHVVPPGSHESQTEQRSAGRLVASLSVEGIRLDFRELQPGIVVRQAFGTEAERGMLDRLNELGAQGLSASELYEALAPDQEIPIALLEAEARSAEEHGDALIDPLAEVDLDADPTKPELADNVGDLSDAGGIPFVSDDQAGVVNKASSGEDFYNNHCGNLYLPLFLFDKSICETDQVQFYSRAHSNPLPTMYWVSYLMNSATSGGAATFSFQWKTGDTWNTYLSGTMQPNRWIWVDHPYVGRLRSIAQGNGGLLQPILVHGYESYRNAPPVLSGAFNYPHTEEREYVNDIQGVTHDGVDTYWYSACKVPSGGGDCEPRIWRIDDDTSQIPADGKLTWYDYPENWSPQTLWGSHSYTHYGALTWGVPANTGSGARVFVPIDPEGSRVCYAGIFNASLSGYYPPAPLPGVSDCPFLAYNPTNGLFYTMQSNKLFMYRITTRTYAAGGGPAQFSTSEAVTPLGGPAGSFNGLPLKDITGAPFAFTNAWVQGGAFALPKPTAGARNKIYVVAQSKVTDGGPSGHCGTTGTGNKCSGIYAIDVITGVVQSFTYIEVDGDYSPPCSIDASSGCDLSNPFGGFDEELEGISVANLRTGTYYHPECSGSCDTQFHLSVLNNEDAFDDGMFVMHMTASSLSGL